ncbi:MAG: hypothetical protein CMA62_03685 [Euryarchaeota archaeon]|jgi:hypothetical protein|nr:hypothetical protein [Euryarchaeota archaeon]|tara:strand:- start:126 stop:962 length:837 start_codon:yes stop_codon:yes gene_type:complete
MRGPVVVVGMHRSGTSLVSRILDDCGVMMGRDLQDDHESLFFIALNEWIYENAGASWERPIALFELTNQPMVMSAIEEYVRKRLSSRSSRAYSGRVMKKGIFDMDGTWGWKDPRNGPTLPLWRAIWPDMKIIHVIRHGVDVAASLKTRNSNHWEGDVSRFKKWLPTYSWRSSKSPIMRGQRSSTLEGGLSFWSEQIEMETDILSSIEDKHVVRYEELLSSPREVISGILEYLSIDVTEEQLLAIEAGINPSRAFAFRNDPELVEFAGNNSKTLEKHGY